MNEEKVEYYKFLKTLYFLKFESCFPEIVCVDNITDELIELMEESIINKIPVDYDDVLKASGIKNNDYDIIIKDQYDLSIDGSKMSK